MRRSLTAALLAIGLALCGSFASATAPTARFTRRAAHSARVRHSLRNGRVAPIRPRSSIRARVAPARVQLRRPAGPPVALQLSALEIHVPIARNAVVHALARDSWPQLVRCVTPRPPARGHARVEIRNTENGVSASVSGPPTSRVPTLARCVREALAGLVLPPFDGDRPPVLLAFDLAFDLPALGPAPRRARP